MIRVLQVLGALVLGGAESRVMDIYRSLDRTKCEFDFVTMKEGTQYYEAEIEALGGKIYRIGFPRKVGIIKNLNDIRKCIREGKYNAVHAHTSYHCGVVMLAAWLEKVPVRIAHARTTGSRQEGIKKKVAKVLGQILINAFSTNNIAISAAAGNYLFGKGDFEVVPNAIDVSKFQKPDNTELERYRQEFGIKDNALVVGHIGRFDDMKNHRFVLECFRSFHEGNPSSVLLLIGDGELKEQMMTYSQSLGIDTSVRFLGERDDVPKLIHLFDVMLFPSKFEGLGGVVIEAQAAGIPTVVSDMVPIETDMGISLVTRCSLSDDLQTWVNAMKENIKKKMVDYGTINRALAAHGYDLKTVTEKFQRLYGGDE